jgi:cell wall assembly regulator SMI1
MTDTLLSEQRLDALAAGWREQRAPIADTLRPGLSGPVMDEATSSLDMTLPIEARVWWGWHDGASTMTNCAIGLDLIFLPLENALDLYRRHLQTAEQLSAAGDVTTPDDAWPRSWLPMCSTGRGAMMVCDCSVPEGAPTPIRHVDLEFFSEAAEPVAASLGTVVSWWLEALDRGAWSYNSSRQRWEEYPDRLSDPLLARSHLV